MLRIDILRLTFLLVLKVASHIAQAILRGSIFGVFGAFVVNFGQF
jgi:hypothetical protein